MRDLNRKHTEPGSTHRISEVAAASHTNYMGHIKEKKEMKMEEKRKKEEVADDRNEERKRGGLEGKQNWRVL